MSNTLNTPVEALELSYPLRVERYALRRGSGGAGRHRGGDGVVRELRVLEDCRLSLLTERRAPRPGRAPAAARPARRGRDAPERRGASAEGDAPAPRRRSRPHRDPRRRRLRPGSPPLSKAAVGRAKSALRSGCGNHQFQPPATHMIDGTSSARMMVASKMIPAASPMPNCLMSTPGPGGEHEEGEHEHEGRARHQLAGSRQSERDRLLRVPRLVVGLAHARDHEDLVIHGQPV